MKRILAGLAVVGVAWAPGASADDAKVNQLIEEIAEVGPEALVARVAELKKQEEALRKEAETLRKQAAEKEAAAKATQKRVQAVETFLAKMAEMAPQKPADQPEQAKADAPPANTPEEATPESEPVAEGGS